MMNNRVKCYNHKLRNHKICPGTGSYIRAFSFPRTITEMALKCGQKQSVSLHAWARKYPKQAYVIGLFTQCWYFVIIFNSRVTSKLQCYITWKEEGVKALLELVGSLDLSPYGWPCPHRQASDRTAQWPTQQALTASSCLHVSRSSFNDKFTKCLKLDDWSSGPRLNPWLPEYESVMLTTIPLRLEFPMCQLLCSNAPWQRLGI